MNRARVASLVDHVGDSPFGELVIGLFVLCLLPADFYNLDIMLQGSTNQAPLAGHVIALVLAVAIPATLGLGALLLVRGARTGRRMLTNMGVLLTVGWVIAIVATYRFRLHNDGALSAGDSSSTTTGVHITGNSAAPATSHSGGGLALLLTLLLVLTSVLAAALAGMREDAEQLKRRRVARRLLWLRWHHRRHVTRADRSSRAAELQRGEITKIETAFVEVAGQLKDWAARHKHTVRLAIAKAHQDPATTSAVMADQRDG